MFVDLLNTLQTSTQDPPTRALEVTTTSADRNLTPASAFAVNLQSQLEKSAAAPDPVADAVGELLITQALETSGGGTDVRGNDLPVQGNSLPVSATDVSSGESVATADDAGVQAQTSAHLEGQPRNSDTMTQAGVRPGGISTSETSVAESRFAIAPDAPARRLAPPELNAGLMVTTQSVADGQVTARPAGKPSEGAEASLAGVESSTALADGSDGLDQVFEESPVQTDAQAIPSSVPSPTAPLPKPKGEGIRSLLHPRDDKPASRSEPQQVIVAEKSVRPEPVKVEAIPSRAIEAAVRQTADQQPAPPMPGIEAPPNKVFSRQPNHLSEQLVAPPAGRLEPGVMSGTGLPRAQMHRSTASGLFDLVLRTGPETGAGQPSAGGQRTSSEGAHQPVSLASVPVQGATNYEAVSRGVDGLASSVENYQRPVRAGAADISSAKQDAAQAIAPDRAQQALPEAVRLHAQTASLGASALHTDRPDAQGATVAHTWRQSAVSDERLALNKTLQRGRDGGSVRAESLASVADSRPLERTLAEQLFVQPARPTAVATDALSSNSSSHAQTAQDAALTQREHLAQNVQAQLQAQITRAMTRQALMQGRISVQLNPVELGAVDLDIATERGEIQIVMVAREIATRDLLDAGLTRLRHSLQEAGLAVSSLDVRHDNADAQRRDARHAFDDELQRPQVAPLPGGDVEVDHALPAQGPDRVDGFYAYA